MNSERQKLLDYMSRLAPPRDVPLTNPGIVHTYQTLYMARLLTMIADEQSESATKLEQQVDRLVHETVALGELTKSLRAFTIALFVIAILQVIIMVFDYCSKMN
jgi:hypothetical protein